MLTTEQAIELLHTPKKIIAESELQDKFIIYQEFPLDLRIELGCSEDANLTFLWSIKQSKKMAVRMSLHCQQEDSHIRNIAS